MEWIFDPIKPSGAVQGGVPSAFVFDPDIDTFVREVLQNARDQANTGAVAEVNFTLQRLQGEELTDFLKACDWEKLSAHLKGVGSGRTSMAIGIRRELERLEEERSLLVLRIDDFNTRGLVGGEDERQANFAALCKNVLDTAEDRPHRGGSFGLGKAVLWRFSRLSTVLFSSTINGKGKDRFRLFGRTELPFHELDDGPGFDGPGWLGNQQKTKLGSRAVSLWDSEAAEYAVPLGLDRAKNSQPGTSILVVGFDNPVTDEPEDPSELADQILESSARWFWPALFSDRPSLRVNVRVIDTFGNLQRDDPVVETDEISNFTMLLHTRSNNERASLPGEIAETEVPLEVPQKFGNDGEAVEGHSTSGLLKIARVHDSAGSPRKNKIALFRGSEMVVKYYDPGPVLGDDSPFFGYLAAGSARSGSEDDLAAEKFLRAAEPPSHNDWSRQERLVNEYARGSVVRLQKFLSHLKASIHSLLEATPRESGEGPHLLARMFPLGGSGGGGNPRAFTIDHVKALFEEGAWRISGRIKRKSGSSGSWQCRVSLWLEVESGGRREDEDMLKIASFEPNAEGEDVVVDYESNGSIVLLCKSYVDNVSFALATQKENDQGRVAVLRRTAVQVIVQPVEDTAQVGE